MASPDRKKEKISSDNRRLISSTAIGEHEQQQPMGSHGKRQSVRVATKMDRPLGTTKPKRCCSVQNKLWMDILPFFDHAQLGLKLALLSPRFDVLVDSHFDGKSELTIWKLIQINKPRKAPKISVLMDNRKLVPFSLPMHPLPGKIHFTNLRIDYFDHSVVAFLRSNQQIFVRGGINLYLVLRANKRDHQPVLDVFAREILPVFAPNIRHWQFAEDDYLDVLLRLTSSSMLTDLDQLVSINSNRLLPNATSAAAGQALFEWLHSPTKDGQPKRLLCTVSFSAPIDNCINHLKEAFLRAITFSSVCYKIEFNLRTDETIVPFELVNDKSNEKLTMGEQNANWVMKRCQIGQMVQWEDEKPNNLNNPGIICLSGDRKHPGWNNFNNICICLCGDNKSFGPFSPPAAGQSGGKDEK